MSASKKGGRPTSVTQEVVSKLEAALREGKTIKMACFLSGISRETYYKHLSIDNQFSDKMEAAQSWVEDTARSRIANAISKGDIATAKWYLERKAGKEFGVRSENHDSDSSRPQALVSIDADLVLDELIERRRRKREALSPGRSNAGNPNKILS